MNLTCNWNIADYSFKINLDCDYVLCYLDRRRGNTMAKRKHRVDDLLGTLERYARPRTLELYQYNYGVHIRLSNPGFTIIDTWPTTGRYWVMDTNYNTSGIPERIDEKGFLPYGDENIAEFLDKLFYAADMVAVNK